MFAVIIICGFEEDQPDEYNCGFENSANFASTVFNKIGAFPQEEILTATRVGTQKSLDNGS